MKISRRTLLPVVVLPFSLASLVLGQEPVLVAGILGIIPYTECEGLLVPSGPYYLLDNTGGFALGDTVVVYANTLDERECNGQAGFYHLPDNIIGARHDFDFGCGMIVIVPEVCPYFSSPRYGDMTGLGLSGYVSDDSVRVFGDLWFPQECIAIPECNAVNCFTVTSVAPCDTSTALETSTWGRLKDRYRPGGSQ